MGKKQQHGHREKEQQQRGDGKEAEQQQGRGRRGNSRGARREEQQEVEGIDINKFERDEESCGQ